LLAFKYHLKSKKYSSTYYDIDYDAIIQHLGSCPGKRKGYHIDHIFPISAFDFNNLLHIKAAFSPENHQWLRSKDNLIKSNTYDKKDFAEYLEKFYERVS